MIRYETRRSETKECKIFHCILLLNLVCGDKYMASQNQAGRLLILQVIVEWIEHRHAVAVRLRLVLLQNAAWRLRNPETRSPKARKLMIASK